MNLKDNKPKIGISIGDCNGVGPEVIMKSLMDARMTRSFTPVIYGHGKILSYYRKALSLEDFNFHQTRDLNSLQWKKVNVINVSEDCPELNPGTETELAGQFALKAFEAGIKDLQQGNIDALVTAPVSKNNINTPEAPFLGHTEHIARAVGAKKSLMMMVSESQRVGLVTAHMPLAQVASSISKELIKEKCEIMLSSLEKDFGINKPKIAVLGLNPHAGEEGILGNEEIEIIKPAINELKDKGHYVFGPYAADGFYGMMQQNRFDGVMAMYHDQGLIPFKAMNFGQGVNYTAGLPVVRTSPDHGTAFGIAGKNLADPGSMRSALFLAFDIVKTQSQESEYVE
ncbi:4-hydroxythreonine-4-phosphate dehydrogenase PdxA [Algoriphagus sediminis]|uniref:4-hydroxythreonine-4-phosphate dehydrogenase PdxA n=1 Tax=Algoriphagus sediminis TaxID=3057113 RepID=A0ABT7YAF4_9BACT|nr:4-hydroxythreonine-4-phosphate dehydrogenase PdxA [Algoriphagus sediminis]MDN3203510.1 4-hydroxythreonine-4-phosphate dehydrogenase PdxA [Algoriphagus sediminis]